MSDTKVSSSSAIAGLEKLEVKVTALDAKSESVETLVAEFSGPKRKAAATKQPLFDMIKEIGKELELVSEALAEGEPGEGEFEAHGPGAAPKEVARRAQLRARVAEIRRRLEQSRNSVHKIEEGSVWFTPPTKDTVITVRNGTLSYLKISPTEGETIRLAPMERRALDEKHLTNPLADWVDEGILITTSQKAKGESESKSAEYGGAVVAFVLTGLLIWGATELFLIGAVPAITITAGVLVSLFALLFLIGGIASIGDALAGRTEQHSRSLRRRVIERLRFPLIALLTFVLSVFIPLMFIGLGSMEFDGVWNGAEDWKSFMTNLWLSVGDQNRMINLCLAVVFSVLPGMLFFVFDRQRLTTLRERFYRDLLLMDHRVRTLTDVASFYGDEMEEVFGERGLNESKKQPGSLLPVLGCTVVLSIGWYVTLLYEPTFKGPGALSAELLSPRPTTVAFAFLGAYFFTIGLTLRGHLRGDLGPKTFNSITVRVLTVIILAWVMQSMPHPERWVIETEGITSLGFAFLVGIFPDSWLTFLQERLRYRIDGLVETNPLTNLEAIDLYDRSRLGDEGINNIEALAHHNLVHLLLRTRIPAARLLDWVDQAVLYLHTAPAGRGGTSESSSNPRNTPPPESLFDKLRKIRIRTATEFLLAYEGVEEGAVPKTRELLLELVGDQRRLDLTYLSLVDDDWIEFIRTRQKRLNEEPLTYSSPERFWKGKPDDPTKPEGDTA